MAVLSDILRRFSVWWANKREKPLRQAIARTQGSATRRVEQRMFEASLGMVPLPCKGRMRSPEVDRIARRARTELMAGHPVRLYVPLRDRQQKIQDGAMNSLEQIRKAVGFGVARREYPAPPGPTSVALVLWPPSDPPGDGGVREPRRRPPDSGTEAGALEP
ncbi:MAG: hypothetical protein QOJ23_3572 [Actinomycetota bacterium]|nr:hypothetical protein [Actinomycetota bacterium]